MLNFQNTITILQKVLQRWIANNGRNPCSVYNYNITGCGKGYVRQVDHSPSASHGVAGKLVGWQIPRIIPMMAYGKES